MRKTLMLVTVVAFGYCAYDFWQPNFSLLGQAPIGFLGLLIIAGTANGSLAEQRTKILASTKPKLNVDEAHFRVWDLAMKFAVGGGLLGFSATGIYLILWERLELELPTSGLFAAAALGAPLFFVRCRPVPVGQTVPAPSPWTLRLRRVRRWMLSKLQVYRLGRILQRVCDRYSKAGVALTELQGAHRNLVERTTGLDERLQAATTGRQQAEAQLLTVTGERDQLQKDKAAAEKERDKQIRRADDLSGKLNKAVKELDAARKELAIARDNIVPWVLELAERARLLVINCNQERPAAVAKAVGIEPAYDELATMYRLAEAAIEHIRHEATNLRAERKTATQSAAEANRLLRAAQAEAKGATDALALEEQKRATLKQQLQGDADRRSELQEAARTKVTRQLADLEAALRELLHDLLLMLDPEEPPVPANLHGEGLLARWQASVSAVCRHINGLSEQLGTERKSAAQRSAALAEALTRESTEFQLFRHRDEPAQAAGVCLSRVDSPAAIVRLGLHMLGEKQQPAAQVGTWLSGLVEAAETLGRRSEMLAVVASAVATPGGGTDLALCLPPDLRREALSDAPLFASVALAVDLCEQISREGYDPQQVAQRLLAMGNPDELAGSTAFDAWVALFQWAAPSGASCAADLLERLQTQAAAGASVPASTTVQGSATLQTLHRWTGAALGNMVANATRWIAGASAAARAAVTSVDAEAAQIAAWYDAQTNLATRA